MAESELVPRTIYVYGKHRSLALAEKHVGRLWRKYPDAKDIYIEARRSERGEFSARGHYFTFAIEILEEEEPEYGGAFDSP